MRCICVLATVAMVTAPAAVTTPAVQRRDTPPRIRHDSRRPVAKATVVMTTRRPRKQRPDVANVAAAATRMLVRRRMRPRLGQAPSGLRHELEDCAKRRRRRQLEGAPVRPTVELLAALSRTNTRISGRCRCLRPANDVHFLTLNTRYSECLTADSRPA